MSTLLHTAALLLTVLGAALLTHGSPLGPPSARQQEAFHLHHRAALRGLAAIKKANEIRAAASARKAVYVPAAASITPVVARAPAPAPVPAPAPTPTAAPVVTSTPAPTREPIPVSAMPVPEIWRQFVLDRLTAAIGNHQRASSSSQPASLPDVTLSQKALTRLLAEAKSHNPQQTSSAWHRSAALQLRAAMDADQKLVLAEKRPGGQEPESAMAKAIAELSTTKSQPVPADTVVPPLTKSELRYIRELLEEALEGDVILPQ